MATVMLAKKYKETSFMEYSQVWAEPKFDGVRCFWNGKHLFSRTGKRILNFPHIEVSCDLATNGSFALDGELVPRDTKSSQTFKQVMKQLYRKSDIDTAGFALLVFDAMPTKDWQRKLCHIPYEKRHTLLHRLCRTQPALVPVAHTAIAPQHADAVRDAYVEAGYEGVVFKAPSHMYRWTRSGDWLKHKVFHTLDLPIVGFEPGKGRHTGRLGAIVVELKGIRSEVGTGFSDAERDYIWRNRAQLLGVTAEVRYQEITSGGRLRFPSYIGMRADK